MRAIRKFGFWLTAVMVLISVASASDDVTVLPVKDEQQLYEFIAEFINNGPANLQFGYLADITGLGSVFSSTTTKDETTALFTIVITANYRPHGNVHNLSEQRPLGLQQSRQLQSRYADSSVELPADGAGEHSQQYLRVHEYSHDYGPENIHAGWSELSFGTAREVVSLDLQRGR
jgi:hypothetical protein